MKRQHKVIYSIGHSNHPLDKFLSLLRASSIDTLVDVRSHPYSRFNPQYNTKALQESLTNAGINYLFLGKELGSRPKDESLFDEEGYLVFDKLASSPLFQEGIDRLERGIADYSVAVMCSEENPNYCHRHRIIAPELERRGITVMHIRGDGRLEADSDLIEPETQPSLFKHSA